MGAAQAELLAAVEQSPQAAAAHDRAGWVGLFTSDGSVEDPVGSRPHVGPTQIGRFYDTFIGPRDLTFHRDLDIVRGPVVIRDLEIETRMSAAVTMRIPAHLRYDLRQVGGEWKIAALRAYWELPTMMVQFLHNGLAALPVTLQLARGLLCNQRLAGTVGFATGLRRVSFRHKGQVDTFLRVMARGDQLGARRALSRTATITFGDDDEVSITELTECLANSGWTKAIAAGPTVAVSVTSPHGRGVLFADVAARGNGIRRIRYFAASSVSDAADSSR